MRMAGNWTDEQLDAINRDDCNILVSAAAGSGKTAVLVERIIRKITDEKHPVSIDRMVVVTFTKAAAAEMKQRIRAALDDMIERNPDSELLVKQLTLLNNAHITTIDSFCLNIVHNHFADIDIDPVFRTADNNEIKLLESDVCEAMLEEYYAKGSKDFLNLVDSFGTGKDDSNLINIIYAVYNSARSNPWEMEWYDECLKNYDINSIKDTDMNSATKYLVSDIKNCLRGYARQLDNALKVCMNTNGPAAYQAVVLSDRNRLDDIMNCETYSELAEAILKVSFDKLPAVRKTDAVDEDKKTYVKTVRDEYKEYVNKTLKAKYFFQTTERTLEDIKHSYRCVAVLVELAREFSKRMTEEKRNRCIIDFNDMEHMALDILVKRVDGKCTYTPVADALSMYYEEIMIDEYQDSNMLQEVILNAVSRNRFKEERNNVYMVGDVKQSIYRFRLACPELFISKYDSYDKLYGEQTGDYLIELRNNFRSRKSILDASNDIFLRLMNREYCGIDYNNETKLNAGLCYPKAPDSVLMDGDIRPAREFGDDEYIDIHLVETADDNEDKADMEAIVIADAIEKMFKKDAYLVYDRTVDGGYRPLRYSDIVILGRAVKNGWADTIVNTLLDRDIPAYADTSGGYFSIREVSLVVSYLTVVDNPLQDVPMAAVLISYFGGFDADELAVIKMYDKKEYIYTNMKNIAVSDEASLQELSKKVARFVEKLDRHREKAVIYTVRDFIWYILYETGYYDYVGTMPAAERRQANLDILLERAAAYESTSYRGLFNFLRYIERIQDFDDMGEVSLLSENDNLVRIMTIHKSKGLEFPVVILAGMGKQLNKMDLKGGVLIDNTLGIGANAVYLKERVVKNTLMRAAVSSKLLTDSISEEMRVMYVAATRAREKLIITGTVNNYDKKAERWRMMGQELSDTGLYSYTAISKIGSYLDMIMPVALMADIDNAGRFKVCYHNDKAVPEDENDTKELSSDSTAAGVTSTGVTSAEVRSAGVTSAEVTGTGVATLKESVAEAPAVDEDIFDIPVYPYKTDAKKKAKITVSELKMMQQADNLEAVTELAKETETTEELVPHFIRNSEDKLVGSERGTAYHRIMECIDYTTMEDAYSSPEYKVMCDNIRAQISDMIEKEKIEESWKESIDVRDIATFCMSDIGRRVYDAAKEGKLRREQPFVFIDGEHDDTQLIQGVIDLYMVEDDAITVVDYKTDKVMRGKEGENELVKRYKVQLDYYAKALSQLTGLRVKDKVIYSFTLGREIIL